MTVVGFNPYTCKFDDGRSVSGVYLHLTEERKGVTGVAVERVFISDEKLKNLGYKPQLFDIIELAYNRFGKISRIDLVSNG